MSNYSSENLILIPAQNVPAGTLAMKIGSDVFTAGSIVINQGTDFYQCATVNTVNQTWTGYKAVLNNGVYTFEQNVTSGLTYTTVTPQVGSVYSDGALIQATLYQGMPTSGLVFYAPLSSAAAAAQTGQTLTVNGSSLTFGTVNGIPCATFSGSQYITFSASAFPSGNSDRTISFWARKTSSGTWMFFNYGESNGDNTLEIFEHNSQIRAGCGTDDLPESGVSCYNVWRHVALVFDSGTASLYVDNVLKASDTSIVWTTVAEDGSIGGKYDGSYTGIGSIAAVRVYDRALSAAEIASLAAEFTPSA